MGGLNPQTTKKPLFWAGLDWLTINCQIDWAEKWGIDRNGGQTLSEKLNDLVKTAQESGEAVEVPEWKAKIYPGGGKIGGVKYCKFRIERDDAIVLIADAQKYKGDWPNVKVEISGERCLVYPAGAIAAYRSCFQWLESIGAHIHKETVSRADLCADFPEFEMAVFGEAFERKWFSCRSNRKKYDESNGLTLYFGAGAIVLRIYDKLREMQASALRGQPAKYEHMIQKRWGGVEPSNAVRVEYQLRREWLKLHGIHTVDCLLNKTSEIIAYLTGVGVPVVSDGKESVRRWFRFLCAEQDNKHPERNYPLPAWKAVQDAFADVFRLPEKLIEIDPDRADIETLLKQAFGVLECAAANKGFNLPWKETAATPKYQFPNYAAFEKWMIHMMRSVAVQRHDWDMKDLPELTGYEKWLRGWEIKQKGKR